VETGLAGRAVLVTGASGGIGWAAAVALAREGCRLALHAHTRVASLQERVRAAGLPPETVVVAADVGDPARMDAAVDEAAGRLAGLDACVASAGIWPPDARRLDAMDPARIAEVVRVNLLGATYTARAFLRQAAATGRRGSSLVLVGSTAGRFGEAGHAEYAISKAGLRGLMLSYKNEVVAVDPAGRVNLVEPGWTLTPMAEGALADPDAVARVMRTRPLRAVATPEDVAAAILYFCAPALSGHVTGETLTVSGGMEGRLLWE
jgi:3-oxoacyl-[acyl-carrier protein] reductase